MSLLLGFYVVTLFVSLVLLAIPPVVVTYGHARIGTQLLFLFGGCWIPALVLFAGVIDVRPPPFKPPGRRLVVDEAPELFALLNELAEGAKTAPPVDVYLAPLPELAVTETGGFFGRGSRRVLIVGAPLLGSVTVQELRAGLAHELGHFAGGDTRLTGILSYTSALFRSVFHAAQRAPFREGTSHSAIELGFTAAQGIGTALVGSYATIYFLIMNVSGRRQEVAADALAARLAGRPAVIRLLERVSVLDATYDLYLKSDVAFAVRAGAMPADLLAGYTEFRKTFDAHPAAVRLNRSVRERKTDRSDTHPSLADRVAFLERADEGPDTDDLRPALALFADPSPVDEWLSDATMSMFQPKQVLKRLPWQSIAADVYTPEVIERARKAAAALHVMFPVATTVTAMFELVVKALEQGDSSRVAVHVEPNVARLPIADQAGVEGQIIGALLTSLFNGALLESGGKVQPSLGAPGLIIALGDEAVLVEQIANGPSAPAELSRWARRLGQVSAA